ncbi:MAG: recombination protein RecR, partial [bacterium]|nr:recombination protein RecR [bacterium]
KAIVAAKDNIRFCSECFNFAEEELCTICSDGRRDRSLICVVERPSDIPIMEKGGRYKGVFHVLGGVLSPLSRIGPEDVRIKELLRRIKDEVSEIIIALNPSVEGEATTLYLTKLIKPLDVKLSRLAQGLPAGGELEFTDELTLSKALEGRVAID